MKSTVLHPAHSAAHVRHRIGAQEHLTIDSGTRKDEPRLVHLRNLFYAILTGFFIAVFFVTGFILLLNAIGGLIN